MQCLLIAAMLAGEYFAASAQSQEVCTGTSCADESSMGQVSFIQKEFTFRKRTENLMDVLNESSGLIEKKQEPVLAASSRTISDTEFNPSLTEDFAVLTRHVSKLHLTGALYHETDLKEDRLMGWSQTKSMSYKGVDYSGTAAVFRQRNMCALVFSATNDLGTSLTQKTFCGAKGVNRKYARELQHYMRLKEWKDVIKELKGCGALFAVGHSMGGAVASLFAFCANTRAKRFGKLPEVRLHTFGAPGVATTVLYNGKPGNCFKGVRQFVAADAKPASKEFHIDNLLLFADVARSLLQPARSEALRKAADKLKSLPYPSVEAADFLHQQHVDIKRMWLIPYACLRDDIKMTRLFLPNNKSDFERFAKDHASELTYEYDPIPQLFNEGLGYLHPLVKAEPLSNVKASPSADTVAVAEPSHGSECYASMPQVPRYDYAQLVWGIINYNMQSRRPQKYTQPDWPNHGTCCMISDAACSNQKYKQADHISDQPCVLFQNYPESDI